MSALGRSRKLWPLRGAVPLSSDQRNLFGAHFQPGLVLSSASSSYAWLKCRWGTFALFGQFHLKLDGGQLLG